MSQYDSPHQFEPLLPASTRLEPLLEQASEVARAASALGARSIAHTDIAVLMRSMNSYYTNLIEGEHTRPAEIQRALQKDFSDNQEVAARQKLALAHMETELECEQQMDANPQPPRDFLKTAFNKDLVCWLHQKLFETLPPQDRRLSSGAELTVGGFRQIDVSVGRHLAPTSASVPAFMDRWSQFYGGVRAGEMAIVASLAAHHRLAWIHPFEDGNGRVARLHTHLVLRGMGLGGGLWSVLRGFARSQTVYRELLDRADEGRRGDLDGRGNLSEQALVEWIGYGLATCKDQIEFMGSLLNTTDMRDRIEASLLFDAYQNKEVRHEAALPLYHLFVTGDELTRAEFRSMSQLGERTVSSLIKGLLDNGYVSTSSKYGSLKFAIPRHALRFYFPNLWPEAEADKDMLRPAKAIPGYAVSQGAAPGDGQSPVPQG